MWGLLLVGLNINGQLLASVIVYINLLRVCLKVTLFNSSRRYAQIYQSCHISPETQALVFFFILVLERQWSPTQVQVRTWGTPCGTPVTPVTRWNSCGKMLAMLAGRTRPRTAGSSSTGLLTATSGTDSDLSAIPFFFFAVATEATLALTVVHLSGAWPFSVFTRHEVRIQPLGVTVTPYESGIMSRG